MSLTGQGLCLGDPFGVHEGYIGAKYRLPGDWELCGHPIWGPYGLPTWVLHNISEWALRGQAGQV